MMMLVVMVMMVMSIGLWGERNDDFHLTCYCLQHSLIYKVYFQRALLVVGDPRAVIGALVTTELTVTL